MGLIDVAFMINERSEANCNGKKRDRIDGHEQIDTLVGPRTSLDMDGTLNLDCYSLGRILYLNCLRSLNYDHGPKNQTKGAHGVLPKSPLMSFSSHFLFFVLVDEVTKNKNRLRDFLYDVFRLQGKDKN